MAREPQGRKFGMPYNWSAPKRHDLGRGVWDPQDDRILTPKNFGWGYSINLHAIGRRLRRR